MDGENEVLTVPQMMAILTEHEGKVGSAATAWESAQRSYEHATDRSRYSTDDAHAASYGEHLPALEGHEGAALKTARVAEINARRVRDQLEHLARPTLTDAEMVTASSRSAVLAIEAERAPLGELIPAIRRAIAAEDRVSQYLYLTLASDRVRKPAPDGQPEEEAARSQVQRLLSQIRQSLRSTEFDALKKRADAALLLAVETRGKAGKRRSLSAIERQYADQGFVRIPDAA